ncbi:MAG: replication-associated recombination protein A [candidate division WOR-3 bacterium]|nr:replication-associated recombination protein A [candidate division WOR-3 bacterium]
MELFEKSNFLSPLADRVRPKNLDEVIGQKHLLSKDSPFRKLILKGKLHSLVFWGPPGTGKTTLAKIIADISNANFIPFSAVDTTINEVKKAIKLAEKDLKYYKRQTIIFIDEIHHFNKAQQDALLPYVEKGKIILICATTENPSFEIIPPLLSRLKVYILNPLTIDEIKEILKRAIAHPNGLKDFNLEISEEVLDYIANVSNGDARIALNILELATLSSEKDKDGKRRIKIEEVNKLLERKVLHFDKKGEEFYNLISAFIKSVRGSDPDAGLYWLARMLEAGCDPLYIARRLVVLASEDIGNADPMALVIAISAKEACEFVGMPECSLALAQATIYLALAPKSNAVYLAYNKAKEDVLSTYNEPVPLHLRNPVTNLMEKLGYGKDYKYPHNYPEGKVNQDYLPPLLKGKKYYFPTKRGFESKYYKKD